MGYIKSLFEEKGITQQQLIEDLNVSQPYASGLMNGKKSIGKKMALRLHQLYGIDINSLILGEQSANPRLEAIPTRLYADPLDHSESTEKIIPLPDGSLAFRVPIVPARAYAGYMRGFADPEYYDDLEEILVGVDREPNGTYIGFEVVGDSMICLDTVELAEESIFPGRIAIGRDLSPENWKTKLHTHNYKNWIFVHKTEGILIKQIKDHNVDNGTVTIHSLNPKYKDETLFLDDMQQIFSVIQIVQKTRPKLK